MEKGVLKVFMKGGKMKHLTGLEDYLCFSCKVYFENNPFNYVHHEEQYITNSKVTILHDYKAVDSNQNPLKHVIATYLLNYGKG